MAEKKKVLFVCVENSCRSQMAEGLARHFGKGVLEAYSAGSRPSGVVNPDAILVMKDLDCDISGQRSKGFEALPFTKFDYVVTMGCGDQCPSVPAEKHIEWNIEDPKGKGPEFFRKVRNDIAVKILRLVYDLNEMIYGRG